MFTICRDLHGMRREYFWEPVAGFWGVRKRGDSQAPLAVAAGDYLIGIAAGDLNPPPVTTIAWRLAHIIVSEGDLVVRPLLLGPHVCVRVARFAGGPTRPGPLGAEENPTIRAYFAEITSLVASTSPPPFPVAPVAGITVVSPRC